MIGCPSIMVNQGTRALPEDLAPCVDALKTLSAYGKSKKVAVIIGVGQNLSRRAGAIGRGFRNLCESRHWKLPRRRLPCSRPAAAIPAFLQRQPRQDEPAIRFRQCDRFRSRWGSRACTRLRPAAPIRTRKCRRYSTCCWQICNRQIAS